MNFDFVERGLEPWTYAVNFYQPSQLELIHVKVTFGDCFRVQREKYLLNQMRHNHYTVKQVHFNDNTHK